MAKITGLGGAFFNVKGDALESLKWYNEVLGLRVTEYGLNISSSEEILVTLKQHSNNAFINFTVDNLEEYLKELKSKGVKVVKEIEEYDYGKFAQIKDLHSNIIELFEVYEEAYHKMIKQELKNYNNIKN